MTKDKKTEPRQQETTGSTAQAAHADTIVPGIQRNYKDRLFRMIFSEKKELLNLYNAVNGTSYTNEDELQIVTLDNAVYMNMKDYVFNSNMKMTVVHWTDHDNGKKKTKVMLICDGKIADANGVILIKKAAAAQA